MRHLFAALVVTVAGCSPALVPVPRDDRVVLNGAERLEFVGGCMKAPDAVAKTQPQRCDCLANSYETYLTQDEWKRIVLMSISAPPPQERLFSAVPKTRAIRDACFPA